jgi:hypothetical protein
LGAARGEGMTSSDPTVNAPISPAAADDVGVAHARWWDALLHEDVAVLDTLLADDLTFHGPSGGVRTLLHGRLRLDHPALAHARVAVHRPRCARA